MTACIFSLCAPSFLVNKIAVFLFTVLFFSLARAVPEKHSNLKNKIVMLNRKQHVH